MHKLNKLNDYSLARLKYLILKIDQQLVGNLLDTLTDKHYLNFQNLITTKGTLMSHELKITDTVEGTGKAAVKGALIICNYEGFLEDGTKFDSSFDHGRPFQFVIGSRRVIQGWDQGLMGMKEGGKRTLFVPSHLGYGDRQIGKFIKPHSNLIFHVELIEVRPRED